MKPNTDELDDHLQDLRQTAYDKGQLLQGLQNKRRDKIKALVEAYEKTVTAQINAEMDDEITAAEKASADAKYLSEQEHIEAAKGGHNAKFPVGAILIEFTTKRVMTKYERVPTGRRAVYEVVTPGSQFADNLRWDQPKPGDFVVRFLKKDGTPSRQISSRRALDNFKLEVSA